jgi:hypothetical protein
MILDAWNAEKDLMSFLPILNMGLSMLNANIAEAATPNA